MMVTSDAHLASVGGDDCGAQGLLDGQRAMLRELAALEARVGVLATQMLTLNAKAEMILARLEDRVAGSRRV